MKLPSAIETINITNQRELELAIIRDECEQITPDGFLFFAKYMFRRVHGTKFTIDDNYYKIADLIVRMIKGEVQYGIVNTPPRCGKTEILVKLLIPWLMVINRKSLILHLSYAQKLALLNSQSAKDYIAHPAFQELWPIEFKEKTDSKELWETKCGGGVYATSTGGQVTGFGAGRRAPEMSQAEKDGDNTYVAVFDDEDDESFEGAFFDYLERVKLTPYEHTPFAGMIIIDDPVKPEDGMFSEVLRDKINERWQNTIRSRRNDMARTPVLVLMQRIHEMDFTGYLDAVDADDWEIVSLPAIGIDEDGQEVCLWKCLHKDAVLRVRDTNKYVYLAQYQQDPTPDQGEYYPKYDFEGNLLEQYYNLDTYRNNGMLDRMTKYICADFAASVDKNDYTEIGVIGVDENRNIYLIDWWSGQKSSKEWIDAIMDFSIKYDVHVFGGEGGPIKATAMPFLRDGMRMRGTFLKMHWVNHSIAGGKPVASRAFQALWMNQRVFLPKGEGCEWVDTTEGSQGVKQQLTKFPNGAFDDKNDVLSILGRLLHEVWAGGEEPEPVSKFDKYDPYEDEEDYGDSWQV